MLQDFELQGADRAQLKRIAQDRLGLVVDFLPETQLPPPGPNRMTSYFELRSLSFATSCVLMYLNGMPLKSSA